jgi:hypothetical protein
MTRGGADPDESAPPDPQIRRSPVLDVFQDHERVGVVTEFSMPFPCAVFLTRTTNSAVPIASTRRRMVSFTA